MLERDIQERFVGFVSGQTEIAQPRTNPLRIYKELIHYRFEEVIRNAMPDFSDILGEERLDALIFDFIRSKPKSPYVWKVPTLFMDFLVEHRKVDDIPYAYDLMWFESIEVELLMGQYDNPKNISFDWESTFCLSQSMRMKVLNHTVNREEYKSIEEHPLIMYYDFQEHAVFFQEITPFMYRFLSYLEELPPNAALQAICTDFSINEEDEVKELLEGALEKFALSSIINPN